MGRSSAKKIAEKNKKILRNHTWTVAVVAAIHILFKFVISSKRLSFARIAGTIFLMAADYVVYYLFIYKHGAPTYDEAGVLEDSGGDLSMANGSLVEYAFDILYVIIAVQILTLISDWFWLLALVVPLFAGYKIYVSILKPYYQNKSLMEDMGMDDTTGKKVKTKRPKIRRY